MDNDPALTKRSRKRVLIWVAVIVALLLSVYSYRYDLILFLPSVQSDRLGVVLEDTQLPFPPTSRVVKFGEFSVGGSYLDWRTYLGSWVWYWESWRWLGPHWYDRSHDVWNAKIVISEASYGAFRDAVLAKRKSPFEDGPYVLWDEERLSSGSVLKKIIVGRRGDMDCVEVIARKENANYAIFVGFECK